MDHLSDNDSSPTSSPGSPVIGHIDHGSRVHARNSSSVSTRKPCPGRVSLFGGRVRHPFSRAAARNSAALSEVSAVRHLLLSVAQAADVLQGATGAPAARGGNSEYCEVRERATRRLHSLNNYLERKGTLLDDTWRASVETGLHRLHRHMGHLPPLPPPDPFHHSTGLTAGHHLFHLHLAVRLLSVSALARLARLDGRPPPPDMPTGPAVPWLPAARHHHRWRTAAHVLLWELTALAHSRLQQVPLADLASSPAFGCGCEKGAWLALRRLLEADGCLSTCSAAAQRADAGGGGGGGGTTTTRLDCAGMDVDGSTGGRSTATDPAALWRELDLVFAHIRCGQLEQVAGCGGEEFALPEVSWSEVPLFLTWMLCAVGDVFRYDQADAYQADVQAVGNMGQLLSLVGAAVAADDAESADESRLGCLVSLCGQLCRLWGPSAVLAAKLWELMWRRLVRPQPTHPVSVTQLTRVLPKSGRDWWEAVVRPTTVPQDSFGQYLRQLPVQLCGAAGADCWRKLRGRVLLRLHARRATQLSAAGLTAACSLFLTLLHTVSDPELLDKYVAFLSLVNESPAHQVLVCRAYFAAVHLLLESERDVTGAAVPASAQADREMRSVADGRPVCHALLAAYVDECEQVFRASGQLDKSQFQLVTAAWRGYLTASGPSEQTRAVAVLLQLAQKLLANIRQLQPMAHVMDTEVVTRTEQYTRLAERLRLLTPFVQAQALTAAPADELADLAATLTLVPGGGCELQHFTVDNIGPSFCAAYVTHLLCADPDLLTADPDRLAHVWLRCFCCAPERAEVGRLTTAVAGVSCLVPDDRPPGRNTAVRFVDRLVQLAEQGEDGRERVNKVVGSLEFIDTYLRTPKSVTVTSHLYYVFGLIIQRLFKTLEQRKVVYIINRLLLPSAVYDSQKPLPPPVRAALARWLPLFMAGISRTEYATHPFYRRCVKDILVNYIFRFADDSQPILNVLRSSEVTPEFKMFVITMAADVFLQKTSGKCHPSLVQALLLLTQLLSGDSGQQQAAVAQQALPNLLELLLTLEEPRGKRAATDLLRKLCQSTASDVRVALSSALERLLERHLAFSSSRVFRLLEVVAVLAPDVTRCLLPVLQTHVHSVEVRRGVGQDRNLRNGVLQVQRRLGVASMVPVASSFSS